MSTALAVFENFNELARIPLIRNMLDWAEQEIILPDGPFKGHRFKASRQPATRLYLHALSHLGYRQNLQLGPSQGGKTLTGSVIPLAYNNFELKETAVFGVPDGKIARDKYSIDIKPVLDATQYADLMPTSGKGSRGGLVDDLIQFKNGASLRFMTAHGDDQNRAAFTTRILVVTEMEAFGKSGASSEEGRKLAQLRARLGAYSDQAIEYLECTVQTTKSITWTEYLRGTQSRCAYPCHTCGEYVTLSREHLVNWQDAESAPQARREARFCCPSCAAMWDDKQRKASLQRMILVHDGQTVDRDGVVHGEPKETELFSFRWTAAENMFFTIGDIAIKEWTAAREDNDEMAEREVLQFVWAHPVPPSAEALIDLDVDYLTKRTSTNGRGILPHDTVAIGCAMDLGLHAAHWVCVALRETGQTETVDYGVIEVLSQSMGMDAGIRTACNEFGVLCGDGWAFEDGRVMHPAERWIDSGGEWTRIVYEYCRGTGWRYRPVKGRGVSQDKATRYTEPRQTTTSVIYLGEGYHIAHLKEHDVILVEINADEWKTRLWKGLAAPAHDDHAHVIFAAPPKTHFSYAKHLLAEEKQDIYVQGKGVVEQWVKVNRNNHWLDGTYMAKCAAHHALATQPLQKQVKAQTVKASPLRTADGRPYLVTER